MEMPNTVDTSGQNVEGAPREATETGSEKPGRLFTQQELDVILKNRLEKYSDYAQLKEYRDTAEEKNMTEVQKLQKQLEVLTPFKEMATKQQKILDGLLDEELSNVPDEYKGLIPESFDTLQRLEYIRKNKGVFFKAPTSPPPNTPVEPVRNVSKPGLYGGKYETLVDFQAKDPKGYAQWRKTNKLS